MPASWTPRRTIPQIVMLAKGHSDDSSEIDCSCPSSGTGFGEDDLLQWSTDGNPLPPQVFEYHLFDAPRVILSCYSSRSIILRVYHRLSHSVPGRFPFNRQESVQAAAPFISVVASKRSQKSAFPVSAKKISFCQSSCPLQAKNISHHVAYRCTLAVAS